MFMRHAGTVLLGVGFVMLAGAVIIRDPTAPDANIGAGILSIIGIPVGMVGLVLTIAHAAYAAWQRSRVD